MSSEKKVRFYQEKKTKDWKKTNNYKPLLNVIYQKLKNIYKQLQNSSIF
jgi:hypothetical protein